MLLKNMMALPASQTVLSAACLGCVSAAADLAVFPGGPGSDLWRGSSELPHRPRPASGVRVQACTLVLRLPSRGRGAPEGLGDVAAVPLRGTGCLLPHARDDSSPLSVCTHSLTTSTPAPCSLAPSWSAASPLWSWSTARAASPGGRATSCPGTCLTGSCSIRSTCRRRRGTAWRPSWSRM